MTIFLTVLGILIFLILIAFLILFFGKAKIRIIYQEQLTVSLSVFGVRRMIYPRPEKKGKKKKAKKVEPAAEPEKKPAKLSLTENLQMIFSLLKTAYRQVKGKLTVEVRQFFIRVGTDDAAKTAMLYGATVGIASSMMQWIHTKFAPIQRKENAMQVVPDFLSAHSSAELDIILKMRLIHALKISLRMFSAFDEEKAKAQQKAELRLQKKKK